MKYTFMVNENHEQFIVQRELVELNRNIVREMISAISCLKDLFKNFDLSTNSFKRMSRSQ